MEDLQHQVAELQEVVRRLHDVRESRKELDSWFQAQSALHSQTAKNSPTSTHRREGSQQHRRMEACNGKNQHKEETSSKAWGAIVEQLHCSAD